MQVISSPGSPQKSYPSNSSMGAHVTYSSHNSGSDQRILTYQRVNQSEYHIHHHHPPPPPSSSLLPRVEMEDVSEITTIADRQVVLSGKMSCLMVD
jgi:hypothetical protein